MVFSLITARKAFAGNAIYCSSELRANGWKPTKRYIKTIGRNAIYRSRELRARLQPSGWKLTKQHIKAIESVVRDYPAFCNLIIQRLNQWTLTKNYFQHLIQKRLEQEAILASDFVGTLLYSKNPLEERLRRLHDNVENLDSIRGRGVDKTGLETDEVLLDIWNEIFVMDFIMNKLGFTDLEKIVRGPSQPQIDLTARFNHYDYAIEITRIRKRNFSGSTMPNMYDAIKHPDNLNSLQKALMEIRFKDVTFLTNE
jgi:hypothetical protein